MSPSKEDSQTKENLKKVGWFALKTVGISAAVLGGVAVAVPAIGFTAGGVAAGSLAAAYQSAFLGGTIASGSTFAVLQSVGAAGLAASTQAGIVGASATVAGAHTAIKTWLKNKKNDPKSDTPDDSAPSQQDFNDRKSVATSDRSLSKQVYNDSEFDPNDNSLVNDEEEADNEDTDENGDKKIVKKPETNEGTEMRSSEANDNSINEREILKQNTTAKRSPSRNPNAVSNDKTKINSLESKWKEVELTDDILISKLIAKRKM